MLKNLADTGLASAIADRQLTGALPGAVPAPASIAGLMAADIHFLIGAETASSNSRSNLRAGRLALARLRRAALPERVPKPKMSPKMSQNPGRWRDRIQPGLHACAHARVRSVV